MLPTAVGEVRQHGRRLLASVLLDQNLAQPQYDGEVFLPEFDIREPLNENPILSEDLIARLLRLRQEAEIKQRLRAGMH